MEELAAMPTVTFSVTLVCSGTCLKNGFSGVLDVSVVPAAAQQQHLLPLQHSASKQALAAPLNISNSQC
jgi:hypothetical protein